jgi:hypothetical protein
MESTVTTITQTDTSGKSDPAADDAYMAEWTATLDRIDEINDIAAGGSYTNCCPMVARKGWLRPRSYSMTPPSSLRRSQPLQLSTTATRTATADE